MVLPHATRFVNDSGSVGGENPQPRAREGTVGRAFDLISVKVTLTEVEGNPSMVCHFRHDERRHAGSAFNIKNYGANHADVLN